VHRPLPSDDPRQRRPDIARARPLLDWQPKVGLRDGVLRTIAYFENDLISRQRRPVTSALRIPKPLVVSLQPDAAD
jgi:UDP-glucuronate decarboxylase